MDYTEEGPVGGQGQDREAELQVHWSQEKDCVVNYDCTRALERAWTIELLNRHGIAWAHLRRNTTMTRLFAQPDGRISKSMSARRGDAWRYHINTRRLEERATWRLALAAVAARHDMPRLGPLLATPHMHTLVRGVQHIL